MYLARTTTERPTRFTIRETYRDGDLLKSRNVFDLGTDPSRYIVYPGGRGYYFDEKMEETLQDQGINPTQDDLDRIFWEFLDPAIKRVINGFQRTRSPSRPSIDPKTKKVHLFDQRRVLYLRFARLDQRWSRIVVFQNGIGLVHHCLSNQNAPLRYWRSASLLLLYRTHLPDT